jgi:hypothetical protein
MIDIALNPLALVRLDSSFQLVRAKKPTDRDDPHRPNPIEELSVSAHPAPTAGDFKN